MITELAMRNNPQATIKGIVLIQVREATKKVLFLVTWPLREGVSRKKEGRGVKAGS